MTPGKRDVSPISRESAVFDRSDRKTGAVPSERDGAAMENRSTLNEIQTERLADRLNRECRDKLRVSYVARKIGYFWEIEKYGPGKHEWKILRDGES